MDSSTRKRKLQEIDKNSLFPSSLRTGSDIIKEDSERVTIKLSLKTQKCKQYENNNITLDIKDIEEFGNLRFYKNYEMKYGNINIPEGRTHFKSCDRRLKRKLLNEKLELEKNDASFDVMPPSKPLKTPNLLESNIIVDPEIPESKIQLNVFINEVYTKEIRMWFACDYIEDILSYEFEKEKQYKLSEDFCKKYEINPARREDLIEWLISVQTQVKAGNNTLHLAVKLLDILLDRIYVPFDRLQVSAIAAFWVAYKFIHGNLSVKTLIGLCAGVPTREMILEQEMLILESSHLLQAGGDLTVFFNYLLFQIFGNSFPPEIYYCGHYFLEIMLLQYMFVYSSASEKAVTAVYSALALFDSSLRFKLFEFTHFITKSKLRLMYFRLMNFLCLMYSDEEILKNSNLYRKYKSSRYFKISAHNILKELKMVKSYNLCI